MPCVHRVVQRHVHCPGLRVLLLHGGDLHSSCQEELLFRKRHRVVRMQCWPWSWPPWSGSCLPQLLPVGSSCTCTAGCILLSSMVSHWDFRFKAQFRTTGIFGKRLRVEKSGNFWRGFHQILSPKRGWTIRYMKCCLIISVGFSG